MSLAYDEYLGEHIGNVKSALEWMFRHELIKRDVYNAIIGRWRNWQTHDESKYSSEEYDAYDLYFYGKEGKSEEENSSIDREFDYAWLHHIHQNPHHWQYWVLIGDEEGPRALEMPEHDVAEMIADWWSFSWESNDLRDIFDWYEKHKHTMILHEKTRALVEDTLDRMADILDDEGYSSNGSSTPLA